MFRRAGFAGNSIGCRPPGTPLFTNVQRLILAFFRSFRALAVEVCAFLPILAGMGCALP